jgi:hypothetical protein
MPQTRKHLRILSIEPASVKPLIHLEQLEPRILLSGDSLLNIAPDSQQNTVLDNTPQVVQYAELLDIREHVEEQISLELISPDTPNTGTYEPIFTLLEEDVQLSG